MKKIFLSSFIIFSAIANAQLDRSIMPTAAPPKANDLKESEVFTTANGITVILSENHKIPKVSFKLIKDVIELLKESTHRTSLKKICYETFKKDYSELCHSIKLVKRTLGN